MILDVLCIILFTYSASIYACQYRAKNEGKRIVGGRVTTIEDVPYTLQIDLLRSNGKWKMHCGATIFTKEFAITAGHCMNDNNTSHYHMYSGSTEKRKGTLHKLVGYRIHEKYSLTLNGSYANHDIAIIKIAPPIQFSDKAKKINITKSEPGIGTKGVVSGWGDLENTSDRIPDKVKMATLSVISRKECQKYFYGGTIVTDLMICASGVSEEKGFCHGDSGGPFVINNELAGVVSMTGIICGGAPGIFTSAPKYKSWVEETIANW